MVKSLSKLGIEGNFLDLIKSIFKTLTDIIILNGERLNALLSRSVTKQDFYSYYPYSA